MRTPDQQNNIDVVRGWATELSQARRMNLPRRRQAGFELHNVAQDLEKQFPLYTPLVWPVEGGREQWPITRGSEEHVADGQEIAVDIACPTGTALLAVQDSVVLYRGRLGDCGIAVDLGWREGRTAWLARYCHLSVHHVTLDSHVRAGDEIGLAGSTGRATGPHLHLALWRDGERVRPEDYLLSPVE